MRFLIFIYGKSRMKRTQLVSDKRAECHILLPKDDFSLERTVFLQFKNISGEWFIKGWGMVSYMSGSTKTSLTNL